MSLSEKQVKQIAYLARLSIDKNKLQDNTKDLNNILSLFDELSKIDTSNIEPMAHPLNMSQRLREDKVDEKNQVELFQEVAPKTKDNYYLVPTVIE